MEDIYVIQDNIERLRDKLTYLIQTREELSNSEILKASVMLDKALNEYDRLRFKRQRYGRNQKEAAGYLP